MAAGRAGRVGHGWIHGVGRMVGRDYSKFKVVFMSIFIGRRWEDQVVNI